MMRFRTLFSTASVFAVAMSGAAVANDNTLFMEQIGDNNFLSANQNGSNNETFAVQQGNFNTGNASTTGNNSQALLYQTGNRNSGGWSSQGAPDATNAQIGIVQETNRNYAGLSFQQNSAAVGSEILLWQLGGNENYIGNGAPIGPGTGNSTVGNGAQNGATRSLANDGVDASLLNGSSVYNVPTSGDQNGAVSGNGNIIGFQQNGARNALALNIDGSTNKIGGNGVVSAVSLDSFTAGGFFSNTAMIDPGDGQFGLSGLAHQSGNDNTGVIAISGNDNAVGFSQSGVGNLTEVYVQGSGNLAIGNQL